MITLSRERWLLLWRDAGATGDPLLCFQRLVEAYSEESRHYHNQQHIAECLAQFHEARHLAQRREAAEFALWFHDAVYDPKAANNEERSAELARECLANASVAAQFIDDVAALVMATKHHTSQFGSDAGLIIDVDLSILGQPEERFREYERQIRAEYAWVPLREFAARRTEILERFLARENIYHTDWFRERLEARARSNLKMSINELRLVV